MLLDTRSGSLPRGCPPSTRFCCLLPCPTSPAPPSLLLPLFPFLIFSHNKRQTSQGVGKEEDSRCQFSPCSCARAYPLYMRSRITSSHVTSPSLTSLPLSLPFLLVEGPFTDPIPLSSKMSTASEAGSESDLQVLHRRGLDRASMLPGDRVAVSFPSSPDLDFSILIFYVFSPMRHPD